MISFKRRGDNAILWYHSQVDHTVLELKIGLILTYSERLQFMINSSVVKLQFKKENGMVITYLHDSYTVACCLQTNKNKNSFIIHGF